MIGDNVIKVNQRTLRKYIEAGLAQEYYPSSVPKVTWVSENTDGSFSIQTRNKKAPVKK